MVWGLVRSRRGLDACSGVPTSARGGGETLSPTRFCKGSTTELLNVWKRDIARGARRTRRFKRTKCCGSTTYTRAARTQSESGDGPGESVAVLVTLTDSLNGSLGASLSSSEGAGVLRCAAKASNVRSAPRSAGPAP